MSHASPTNQTLITRRRIIISFRYYQIPIGPRIQQLMEVLARCHMVQQKSTNTGNRYNDDIQLSPVWQDTKIQHGEDVLGLSFCSDGFNPWHHHITQVLI